MSSPRCISWLKLFTKLSRSGTEWYFQLSILSPSNFLWRLSFILEVSLIKVYLAYLHFSAYRSLKFITSSNSRSNISCIVISRCVCLWISYFDTFALLFSSFNPTHSQEEHKAETNFNAKMIIESSSREAVIGTVLSWTPWCSSFLCSSGVCICQR